MEIKILLEFEILFKDCETSEVERWGVLLRLSRNTLSCREKLCLVVGYFRFVAEKFRCFAILFQLALLHSSKRKRG